jgi:DNA-binding protein H-NS
VLLQSQRGAEPLNRWDGFEVPADGFISLESLFLTGGIMAKKAKRRGRPPGSKNKKKVDGRSLKGAAKNLAKMEAGQLRAYIDNLEGMLAAKVQQQREILEGQLEGLQSYASDKAAGIVRTVMQVTRTGKRAKAKPKYQSKKKSSLKWSGRGMLPVWMREEMKGTKLTKDDFLIR